MALISTVLAMMATLSPGDHSVLATAIAARVDAEAPLFMDDADKRRTASFLVAVAFRESTFKLDAIGDHGKARCAFQLWHAPKAVLADADLCVGIAFARLRESFRICGPTNVLGIYASGPKGCASEKAARISRDRLALSRRVLAAAEKGGDS